jgi:hypothetical protein
VAAATLFDVVVVADASSVTVPVREAIVRSGRPVCWYSIEAGGFTSGVHPAEPLPASAAISVARRASAMDDAASCDVAALACATILELSQQKNSLAFERHE